MGIDDWGFLKEEKQPYCLERDETEDQRDLSRRMIESYQYGLEEMDVWEVVGELNQEEVETAVQGAEALMLSSFCTGGCRECGWDARPYSAQNRKIFALEPLIDFLEQHRIASPVGEIMLYDASDPLNYPYLLQLLDYLEQNSEYREVLVYTSCPPGTEELYQRLLERRSPKVRFQLSMLPSNMDRLRESGIAEMTFRNVEAAMAEQGDFILPSYGAIGPRGVGRLHQKGSVAAGFSCGDMTILSPDRGFSSAIYHLASDLYPTERQLTSVVESRRVYLNNKFFSFELASGLRTAPILYTPGSTYIDLGSKELVSEMGLRHLAAYIHSVLMNFYEGRDYGFGMVMNWEPLEEALKSNSLIMPDDVGELNFYKHIIPAMLRDGRETLDSIPKGAVFLHSSGFVPEKYDALWSRIEQHRKMIFRG